MKGDRTVPVVSAERISPGLDQNAPGVTPCKFLSPSNPDQVEHTGLTKNYGVHKYILSALQSTQRPPCPGTSSASEGVGMATNDTSETPSQPAHYIRIFGVTSVLVEDSFGNSNAPVDEIFIGRIPGVTYQALGDKAFLVITPSDQTYTLTLDVGTEPIAIELIKGTSTETTQAIRYQDLQLPAGVKAKFQITPQDLSMLHYDGDGDGTFETPVMPTVSITGVAAEDTAPPVLSASQSVEGSSVVVTLAASDLGSGVKAIYYSTDGTNYRTYEEPIILSLSQKLLLYYFADDNLANRSGLLRLKVISPLRRPAQRKTVHRKTAPAAAAQRQLKTQAVRRL
jgi:hypothetical protein